ncbi:ATP-dependent DNA ligase [Achromobacter sp. AGC39]
MMSSTDILLAVETIAGHSGKLDKQRLVASYGAFDEFKRVLVAALDPFVTYGIRQVPDRTSPAADGWEWGEDEWLLLDDLATRKLTGNAARDRIAATMNALNASSAELLKRVILKDLRAGFSEETVNKAFKGLIKTFPYMRCSLPKDADLPAWDWAGGVVSQQKADGMFVNVDREGDRVRFSSRQGKDIDQAQFPDLAALAIALLAPDTQTHGELLVERDKKELPREIGNGMLNKIAQGGGLEPGCRVVLRVWDQIPASAVVPKGKHAVPYKQRLRSLGQQLAVNRQSDGLLALIDTRIVYSMEEAFAHYRQYLAQGKEGTVLKKMTAIWRDGTSKEQIKLKLEAEVDLVVRGIVPGKANTKNEGRAGSLACESACGRLKTDVTVKNEAMRDDVDANPNSWIDSIIKVKANSIMAPSASSDFYSLFLPRMTEACFRTDKHVADTLEQVQAQFDAAVAAA